MARVLGFVRPFVQLPWLQSIFIIGDLGYLAYLVDTRDKGRASVLDVQVVREFLDVAPKDLPGVPLVRVEFKID